MSEYGRDRPDIDALVWAEGVGHEPVTAVNPAKADVGYAFSDPLPAEEFNWLVQNIVGSLVYLDGGATREFSSMASALKATIAAGRRFAVRRAAGAARAATAQLGSQGASAVSEGIGADGKQIYYEQVGEVCAEDPDNPSVALWTYTMTGATYLRSVSADGGGVYLGLAGMSSGGDVRALNPIDGSTLTGWSSAGVTVSGDNVEELASNGFYLAVVSNNTAETVGNLECWESRDSTAGVARTAYLHGAALFACAIDSDYAYIGGAAGTGGHHVRAMVPTVAGTPTVLWSHTITATTSGTPIVRSICCDGERVFVVGDLVIDATIPVNVWCFSRETDSAGNAVLLWSSETPAGVDAVGCTADDQYLYVSDADSLCIFDKVTGAAVGSSSDFTGTKLACDGVEVWGKAGNNVLRSNLSNRLTQLFVKASDVDPYRRHHRLAVPQE